MKSLAIIVFYFGEFPWYYQFFRDSCRRNVSLDFIILSDNFVEKCTYENITEIPFSISQFNSIATEKLGFKVTVQSGLKICDLRPSFGLIFEDYLKDYDFWGYSDIDIILGRAREFITDEVLNSYDFISVKSEYPSGFFAIYRNCEKVNTLFLKSKDHRTVFSNSHNMLFEECGGHYREVVTLGLNILETDCSIETFHHVLEKNKDVVNSLFEFFSIESTPGLIRYSNEGILSYRDEFEVMMYHMSDFKKNVFLKTSKLKNVPPSYAIDKYSVRNSTFFHAKIGYAYERFAPKLFFSLIRIELQIAKIYSRKNKIKSGNYQFMDEIIRVLERDGEYRIEIQGQEYHYVKSFLFKRLYIIKDKFQVVKTRNNSEIILVLKNGNIKMYSGIT